MNNYFASNKNESRQTHYLNITAPNLRAVELICIVCCPTKGNLSSYGALDRTEVWYIWTLYGKERENKCKLNESLS